eukprot:IDg1733t1
MKEDESLDEYITRHKQLRQKMIKARYLHIEEERTSLQSKLAILSHYTSDSSQSHIGGSSDKSKYPAQSQEPKWCMIHGWCKHASTSCSMFMAQQQAWKRTREPRQALPAARGRGGRRQGRGRGQARFNRRGSAYNIHSSHCK